MEIPYTIQPREDTGLFNAKVGIWLFLASEVMLFGALFSAYILLRVGSTNWLYGEAKDLNVWLGTLNTAMIRARLMFPACPRSNRETATVTAVPSSKARKTPIYTLRCFLMS